MLNDPLAELLDSFMLAWNTITGQPGERECSQRTRYAMREPEVEISIRIFLTIACQWKELGWDKPVFITRLVLSAEPDQITDEFQYSLLNQDIRRWQGDKMR